MDDIVKEIRSEFSRLKNQLQEGNIAVGRWYLILQLELWKVFDFAA